MVLTFWDTFNIEIDCLVMRLSCLDELVNNRHIVISVIRVICFAKKVQYFGGTFWHMKVDVLFCLSLQEMTTSLLDGIL